MTEKPKAPKRRKIKLEVPASLTATYVNFAMIMHTSSEIIIDMAQVLPNLPKARVQTRVVLTPTNARLLYNALGENLANYESKFGSIKTPPTLADHLFSSIGKPESDDGEDDAEAQS